MGGPSRPPCKSTPWSADALQGSAYGGLLVRALERSEAAEGMTLARLSFDLWRPVTRERITPSVTVLRDGRKARTVESSLAQGGKPVARCTGVFLKADAAATPVPVARKPPPMGPDAGRTLPPRVKAWSPFFTGVVLWRVPRVPWILLSAETRVGDQGTGVGHGTLSDLDGPFGACEQTLLFEKRR